ncbi:hypothetical protein CA13_23790 [Planctomycetes bacterium CA13]|uniref:Uncharacterized protein n=1 Tax=Novipirellula herctigrandis TaxID=2527986 RepID=A0A5C5Z0N0_9BACT|nr:hypothetical protein CA13_23790 [Planctomycetes bacterium CA13]
MFAGSILIGLTLLGFAVWLHLNERRGWGNESFDDEEDRQYLSQRKRARAWVNSIFAVCGIAVLVAAVVGPGPVWIGVWMSVAVGLMTIVILAGLDAIRTLRHQSKHRH